MDKKSDALCAHLRREVGFARQTVQKILQDLDQRAHDTECAAIECHIEPQVKETIGEWASWAVREIA